jgi:citrate synthase
MNVGTFLSAREAARELGISLPTLYSYVSRGLLRSEAGDERSRARRYPAADVQRLKERQQLRRDPGGAVETALDWGMPVLDSALTLIENGRCYYRGQDALDLAMTESAERVAALLWTGETRDAAALFDEARSAAWPRSSALLGLLSDIGPVERFSTVLPVAAGEDPAAYDLRPAAVAQTGARILELLTEIATGFPKLEGTIAEALQSAWTPANVAAVRVFNAALVVSADHELNVSSFTVRCVASAGANPYLAVVAGLAALQGVKHGGMCGRVEALLREAGAPERARDTLAARLRRGEPIPGFGHRMYPQGDPRGRLLLHLAAEAAPGSPAVALAEAVAREAEEILGEAPVIDYGLVALCGALGLPPGSALALFALGRTIGWIGHAIEQYGKDRLIRPRAQYTGEPPHESHAREGQN